MGSSPDNDSIVPNVSVFGLVFFIDSIILDLSVLSIFFSSSNITAFLLVGFNFFVIVLLRFP